MSFKPQSSKAIKHLAVLNMAIGMLKVRKFADVVSKAVTITDDKKIRNQKRKVLARIDEDIKKINSSLDLVFAQLHIDDFVRIRKANSFESIKLIPEDSTNPEILALNLLFITFQDHVDPKLSHIFSPMLEFDYMDLIITISEEIGLKEDVAEDMYPLAHKIIEEIHR